MRSLQPRPVWFAPVRSRFCHVALVALVAAGVAPAQVVTFPTPTAAYLGSTTKLPIPSTQGTQFNSLSDGIQTVTLSSTVATQTGAGSSFGWGNSPTVESSTPLVFFTGQTTNSLTLLFSAPVATFGVEMLPNSPSVFFGYTMKATFFDGPAALGSISQSLVSPGGAHLFAAQAPADAPFTSVTLTAQTGSPPSGTQGFEVGQVRYAIAVPEPTSLALVSLAGAGWLVRRRCAPTPTA